MSVIGSGDGGQGAWDGRTETEILGYTLPIEILAVHDVGRAGRVITVSLEGVIDTGASMVCIPRRVAKELGLQARDKKKSVELASGNKVAATIYSGGLRVPRLQFEQPIQLLTIDEGPDPTRALLGREFLNNFVVTFDPNIGGCLFVRRGWRPPFHDHDE